MTREEASEVGLQPDADSLVEILRCRAVLQPDRLAYHFLTDGGPEGIPLTYYELDRNVRAIAARLRQEIPSGERVLLLYPAGPDFLQAFLACLYADVVAVPLYPPRPGRSLARWTAVYEDSGARAVLTQASRAGNLQQRWAEEPGSAPLRCLATDEQEEGVDFIPTLPDGGSLAYLQYTSGSTSSPKGVMVTHGNLVYNCDYMRTVYELSADSVGVTWVPHFHDLGLIDGLLSPLFTGFPAAVLSAGQFAQRPILWLETIARFKATHSGGPNFAFELCLQKIKPEQRAALDLSSWSLAFSGAEPVRAETIEAFSNYFEPCGFRRQTFMPAYGLAEATLLVTGGTRSAEPIVAELDGPELEQGRVMPASPDTKQRRLLVGCGHIRPVKVKVVVVDPVTTEPVPDEVVGEIWASGPTIAAGYWQRQEDTDRTFRAYLPDGDGPYLRTGDLGYLQDGELFVAARLKDLIIVRGGNVFPQDVEWAAQRSHPQLRRGYGAAFGTEVEGNERLVLIQEVDRQLRKASEGELEELASSIRQVIAAEFDLETYCVMLVMPGEIPMTSSGKVQRHVARAQFMAGGKGALLESRLALAQAPAAAERRDQTPRVADWAGFRPADRHRTLITYLRQKVAEVLGVTPGYVLPDKPLGSFGLDSLKGNELTATLSQDLGIELSPTLVWNHPTVAEIAAHVGQQLELQWDREGNKHEGSRERLQAG